MELLEKLLPLARLKSGQTAVVEDVCCGNPDDNHRLASMGFRCGALVCMVAAGCPCAVQVGETRIMLRGSHTEAIRVSVLGHPSVSCSRP